MLSIHVHHAPRRLRRHHQKLLPLGRFFYLLSIFHFWLGAFTKPLAQPRDASPPGPNTASVALTRRVRAAGRGADMPTTPPEALVRALELEGGSPTRSPRARSPDAASAPSSPASAYSARSESARRALSPTASISKMAGGFTSADDWERDDEWRSPARASPSTARRRRADGLEAISSSDEDDDDDARSPDRASSAFHTPAAHLLNATPSASSSRCNTGKSSALGRGADDWLREARERIADLDPSSPSPPNRSRTSDRSVSISPGGLPATPTRTSPSARVDAATKVSRDVDAMLVRAAAAFSVRAAATDRSSYLARTVARRSPAAAERAGRDAELAREATARRLEVEAAAAEAEARRGMLAEAARKREAEAAEAEAAAERSPRSTRMEDTSRSSRSRRSRRQRAERAGGERERERESKEEKGGAGEGTRGTDGARDPRRQVPHGRREQAEGAAGGDARGERRRRRGARPPRSPRKSRNSLPGVPLSERRRRSRSRRRRRRSVLPASSYPVVVPGGHERRAVPVEALARAYSRRAGPTFAGRRSRERRATAVDGRIRAVLACAVLARSDAEDVPAPGYRQRRRASHRERSPRQDPIDDDDDDAGDDAGDAGGVHQARVRRVGGAGALGATRAVDLSNALSRGAGVGSSVYEQIAREGPNDAVAPDARLLRDRVEVRGGGARQVHRGAVARVPADAVVATQRVQQPASRRSRRDALAGTAAVGYAGAAASSSPARHPRQAFVRDDAGGCRNRTLDLLRIADAVPVHARG